MAYDVGDIVRISAAFTVGGAATDPTTITLKVKTPAGVIATYTYAAAQITRDSAGNYHKDITIDAAGDWWFRWESTGTAQAAEEGVVPIQASHF